jgi:undecaprenyl-diphosphatase
MVTTTPAATRTERSRPVLRAAAVVVGAWAVILAVVLAVGWLLTHALRGAVLPWDNGLSRWIAGERTGWLNEPADVGTFLGETMTGVTVALLAGLAVALWRRSWRPLLFVVLAEAGIGGFYAIATTLDPRQRPPVRILDAGLVPNHSFPSGHTATAVVAYAGIVLLLRAYARVWRWALVLLAVPVVVVLARLYQGAHHLTDVLTSLVYASAYLLVVARQVLPTAGAPQVGTSRSR